MGGGAGRFSVQQTNLDVGATLNRAYKLASRQALQLLRTSQSQCMSQAPSQQQQHPPPQPLNQQVEAAPAVDYRSVVPRLHQQQLAAGLAVARRALAGGSPPRHDSAQLDMHAIPPPNSVSNGHYGFSSNGVGASTSLNGTAAVQRPNVQPPQLTPFAPSVQQRPPNNTLGYPAALQQQQHAATSALLLPRTRAPTYPPPPNTASSSSQVPPVYAAPHDGGPPFKVPVNMSYSRLSQIPSGQPFPSIASVDQVRVKQWMDRDSAFEREATVIRSKRRQEVAELADEAAHRQDWLGGDGPRGRFKVRSDAERSKDMQRGKRGPVRRELKVFASGHFSQESSPEN